jgi:hypothetical protein
MRTCSKERTNIPITISVLHDQEYQQLCRLLHRSGRRRAFTERQIESSRKTITGLKGPQVASTQMFHQEVDA